LFKVIAFIFIFNFIMISSLYGWVAYSVIVPSLAETGITVMDLIFKKNIDPEKAQEIQQNIDVRSAKLGNDAADKVLKGLTALFVPSKVSKVPQVKYPTLDEKKINEIQARALQKGTEEGQQTMQAAEKKYDAIRKQTLSTP
ncbi:MAG TPA: hypothetical protein VFC84_03430, partial [Desulfosporosinus sp.]|nr:hypothetical protein [Desulfosporosinus sp.]